MSENGKWDDYDKFLAEADKDDRVGDHDFLVQENLPGQWDDGSPRVEVRGVLVTARSAEQFLTWTPPPSPAELEAQKESMDRNRQQAIANSIRLARALQQHYGKEFDDLTSGNIIRVKVVKNKKGFTRIVAILPPAGSAGAASEEAPAF